MIQINESVIGIDVPMDSIDIQISFAENNIDETLIYWTGKFNDNNHGDWVEICLPQGEWMIEGFATKDEATFDCENYVESELKSVGYIYLDYNQPETEKRPYKFDKTEDSFRSKIEFLTGKKWWNPIPKPTEYKFNSPYLNNYYTEQNKLWQEAENNLLKKVVVLTKIK